MVKFLSLVEINPFLKGRERLVKTFSKMAQGKKETLINTIYPEWYDLWNDIRNW